MVTSADISSIFGLISSRTETGTEIGGLLGLSPRDFKISPLIFFKIDLKTVRIVFSWRRG